LWTLVVLSQQDVRAAFRRNSGLRAVSGAQATHRTDWRAFVMGVGVRDGRKVINWPGVIVGGLFVFACCCVFMLLQPELPDSENLPATFLLFVVVSAFTAAFFAWVQSHRPVEQLPSLDRLPPGATGSASAVPAARRTDWRAGVMGVGVRDGRKVINWPVLLVQWVLLFAVLCAIWLANNPPDLYARMILGFSFVSAIFVVFIAWVQSSRSVEQLPSLDNTRPVWTIAARLLFGGLLLAHAIPWWFGSRDIAAIRLRAPWSENLFRPDKVGALAIGLGLISLIVAVFLVKKKNLVRTIVSLVVVGLVLLVAVMFSQMLAVRKAFLGFDQAAPSAPSSADAVPATVVGVLEEPGRSWIAPLDVGEIELVAVSRHPSMDEPWWRPDGSPYTEKPFDTSGGRFTVSDPTVRHYEFVFRLPVGASIDVRGSSLPRVLGGPMGGGGGSLGADSRGSWGGGGTFGSAAESPYGLPPDFPEYQYKFAAFPESADAVTFQLAVATSPWTIVATHDRPGSQSMQSGFRVDEIEWTISFGPAIETAEGDLVIAVAHNEPFRDTRVVAIDSEGKEHSPCKSEGLGLGNVRQLTFQNLPLARVKEFQLQSRPYRLVEFRNVALRPKSAAETAEPSATGSDSASDATSLSEAIRVFNARARENFIGKDQLPLTEDEVITAIRWPLLDTDKLPVSDKTLEALRKIVEFRALPRGFELEVLTRFRPNDRIEVTRWSVRLRIPAEPHGTTCISIREKPISSRLLGDEERKVIEKWANIWHERGRVASFELIQSEKEIAEAAERDRVGKKSGESASAEPATANGVTELVQQGWQLWWGGRPDKAVPNFEQSVKLHPNDADAWNGLGWAALNSGNSTRAKEAFEKTVALQPNHPGALNGLGQLHLAQREYDLAEPFLLKAAPEAPDAWWGLARLYLLQGKFDQAEKWARQIVELDQGDESSNDIARRMLEAAKKKELGEALRMIVQPPLLDVKGDGAEAARIKLQAAEQLLKITEARHDMATATFDEVLKARLARDLAAAEVKGDTAGVPRIKLQVAEQLLKIVEQRYDSGAATLDEVVKARLARDLAAAEVKDHAAEPARKPRDPEPSDPDSAAAKPSPEEAKTPDAPPPAENHAGGESPTKPDAETEPTPVSDARDTPEDNLAQ
ncbi:MAG TPA: hypothetical protein DD670_01350, partial [Planctomycetaceae bacterium]|nr:hypothetical protein [Planctomycetaceae bacterium]